MATKDEISISELAKAVVAEDPDLRAALKTLVMDMVNVMRYTMRQGTPEQKISLARSIAPQLLAAIRNVEGQEGEAERRAAYERMLQKMNGSVP